MTMFSIIATDYEGAVPESTLQRFLDSLKSQSFKDFDVIILHDGKRNHLLDVNYDGLDIRFVESMFRANVWGHNLRTYGMLKAKGDFMINTNTDNVYYPDALEKLSVVVKEHPKFRVFINKVKMMGMYELKDKLWVSSDKCIETKKVVYDNPRDYRKSLILTGNPPVWGNIDLMSLVAHKDVWESIFYWYDLDASSDGHIYTKICSLYPYYHTDVLLGEHY
jgi:glycosyltransferase involved in cell wall biosynthesis